MRPNPSLERDLHRHGTWPARLFRSSSASRAKHHSGSGPSAQTLGVAITTMATLLQLFKAARGLGADTASGDHVARFVRLADAEPNDEGAQAIAAYKAWMSGNDETAYRLAVRAERSDGTSFPALLVLVAISSKGADERRTYSYAKQLTAARRNDKTANSVSKLLAGTRLLGPSSRREQLEHHQNTDQTHDEWVAWAAEFIDAYEARHGDA